jgi:hypothetical protein
MLGLLCGEILSVRKSTQQAPMALAAVEVSLPKIAASRMQRSVLVVLGCNPMGGSVSGLLGSGLLVLCYGLGYSAVLNAMERVAYLHIGALGCCGFWGLFHSTWLGVLWQLLLFLLLRLLLRSAVMAGSNISFGVLLSPCERFAGCRQKVKSWRKPREALAGAGTGRIPASKSVWKFAV